MGAKATQRITVALAGNPNVGKSSLFNALTGLHHPTGNWAGKTVDIASGCCRVGGRLYEFVDLPGSYALLGNTRDEKAAADYLASGRADCLVVVCQAEALERNLIYTLQLLSQARRAVVCVNCMEESRLRGLFVDTEKLASLVGVPVVLCSPVRREGLTELLEAIDTAPPPQKGPWQEPVSAAQAIAFQCLQQGQQEEAWRLALDKILVSRRYGIPILLSLFFLILCLTVWGANIPSALLQRFFDWGQGKLSCLPPILVEGVYATVGRVLSVMVPPLGIFFLLFSILEESGYLPRMAFLLDGNMRKCGGCGKQALTLCMGLGCNAVAVSGCRIIDSPRERLAAILTNAMVPCNGRFPTLILLAAILSPPGYEALVVAAAAALGILGAVGVSALLGRTVLRQKPSIFLLELPPMRLPRLGSLAVRALGEKTLSVALRALTVAAPAGAVLWILQSTPLLGLFVGCLEPFGVFLGMNGGILTAFILSIPANELWLSMVLLTLGTGDMDWQTALCALVFTLFHWPCATTLQTIYRETRSIKQTAAAFFLPTAVGVLFCSLLNILLHLLG